MAKGDIKKLKFESFYDSESNNEVIRLTPTDILCHHSLPSQLFLSKMFYK